LFAGNGHRGGEHRQEQDRETSFHWGIPIEVCKGQTVHHATSEVYYFFTEKVRSILLVLPWRSRTETVSLPLARSASGAASASSHTPSDFGRNRFARFFPGAIPPTGKSATTWKLSMSSPLS